MVDCSYSCAGIIGWLWPNHRLHLQRVLQAGKRGVRLGADRNFTGLLPLADSHGSGHAVHWPAYRSLWRTQGDRHVSIALWSKPNLLLPFLFW